MISQTTESMSRLGILVEEFLMLISESIEYHPDSDIQAVLQETFQIAKTIHRRIAVSRQRFVMAIVGQANVGKSTLLAALLGEEISPRRNGPCTATSIEYSWGPTYRIEARYRGTLRRDVSHCGSSAETLQQLTALADESSAGAGKRAERILVQLPLELLHDGLVVADTPGFGAAHSDVERDGTHDESVRSYLHSEVSQVLWVVLGDQAISKREHRFYEQFLNAICDDVVVTGCEDWTASDRQRFQQRMAAPLHLQTAEFHFVSGLQGLQARKSQDSGRLNAAGIPQLETRVRLLADPVQRYAALESRLAILANALGAWMTDFRRSKTARRTQSPWRPDSWLRWLELPATPFKRQLDQALQQGAT